MVKSKYTPIDKIIRSAKKGEMYILVDDENRENEGDLVVPASNVSSNKINFMAKYGRGLICLAITDKQAKKLNLSLMSPINNSRNQTAFTPLLPFLLRQKRELQLVFQLKIGPKLLKQLLKIRLRKKKLFRLDIFFQLYQKRVVY